MKYIIPIQQEIRVWTNTNIVIETDDTPEEILQHVKEGDLLYTYEVDEYGAQDFMWDTEEVLNVDYDFVELDDIEEL